MLFNMAADVLAKMINMAQANQLITGLAEEYHYRKKDLCRVSNILPSVFLGHSAKSFFAECRSLPSAFSRHSAKKLFAECLF
jgi:hypothetical protein